MDQIHQHMTESYAASVQEGEQPEWVNTLEREGTDMLDAPFTKDEVVFQPRRLVSTRLTYQNWTALDSKAELLVRILNLCRKVGRLRRYPVAGRVAQQC